MDSFAKIAVLDNDVEARLIESILNELGIPHVLQTYRDTAYDGLFQTQKGWGQINAPASCQEEILEVLSEVRRQAAAMPES